MGDLNIEEASFTNNETNGNGGAIYSLIGNQNIKNSDFTGNKAEQDGGAIYALSLDNSKETTTITDSNFINNTAVKNGGAISLETHRHQLLQKQRRNFLRQHC